MESEEIGTPSALLVELLKRGNPEVQSRRWKRNVVAAVKPAFAPDLDCLGDVVPDAHLIDRKRKTVIAYEMEDQTPLTDEKLLRYMRVWAAITNEDWKFELIRLSPSGITSNVDFETSRFNRSMVHEANRRGMLRAWTPEERRTETLKRPPRVPPARFRADV